MWIAAGWQVINELGFELVKEALHKALGEQSPRRVTGQGVRTDEHT